MPVLIFGSQKSLKFLEIKSYGLITNNLHAAFAKLVSYPV